MERPKIQHSQIVFGDFIYWLTIAAAIICIIGPLKAFSSMDGNILNLGHLFANIWSGAGPEAIWQSARGAEAEGFYWIHNLAAGDGFTYLGLFIGCAAALPAMIAAAILYAFKEKSIGWAVGALWIAGLITVSILGLVSIE